MQLKSLNISRISLEQMELSCTVIENANTTTLLWKTVWQFLINIPVTYDPFLNSPQREMKAYVPYKRCVTDVHRSLFVNIQPGNNMEAHPIDYRMN